MATAMPEFEQFNIHKDTAVGQRWSKWVKRLENFFVAANITTEARKRALLLHYAGEEVHEIFDNLIVNDSEDVSKYNTVRDKLLGYFNPKKSTEYEIYVFRQAKQATGETVGEFCTRLRQLSVNCEFSDKQSEIKSQIIQNCTSNSLRRKALSGSMTLDKLLSEARSLELSDRQAREIEGHAAVNQVHTKWSNSKPSKMSRECYNCGEAYPHDGECPAKSRKCAICKQFGHYAKKCKRNAQRGQARPKGNWNNRNKKTSQGQRSKPHHVHQVSRDTVYPSDDEYVFSVHNTSSLLKPEICVVINGVNTNVLVDSGASVNVVNESVAKSLSQSLSPCDTYIYAFGSDVPLPVCGKFKVNVKNTKGPRLVQSS